MNAIESLKYFIPEFVLLGGAFLALFLDFFKSAKKIIGWFCLTVVISTLLVTRQTDSPLPLFFGMFYFDAIANISRFIALFATASTLVLAFSYSPLKKNHSNEFYALLLFVAFFLICAGAANNLLMIYLSVEAVSIVSYLLVGFLKNDPKAKESSLKYLLFGTVCSAVMLYGMSLIFGVSGSLELPQIMVSLFHDSFHPIAVISVLFFFAGLGFKVAMAPFHLWSPDVYEGAPTPVTAFLSVAPKAMGFIVLLRVLATAFIAYAEFWSVVLTTISILTMSIGNLTAISQNNAKRFFAYSSIAQAGYILMGLAVASGLGANAVLIYLAAYLFTNLGAFAVIAFVEEKTQDGTLDAFSGLAKRAPAQAALLTVFLLSLAGIPPLAGFIGKYYVFAAAIESNAILLAVAAAINSVVAVYYYFRVVRLMYLSSSDQPILGEPSFALSALLWILAAATIVFGVFPNFFITQILG